VITRQVVELIKEDEIQDAGLILENIGLWDNESPERNKESPNLGGVNIELLSTDLSGQDSGVGALLVGSGLLTLENTPEPESMHMPGP
jgi:hypothetical protein